MTSPPLASVIVTVPALSSPLGRRCFCFLDCCSCGQSLFRCPAIPHSWHSTSLDLPLPPLPPPTVASLLIAPPVPIDADQQLELVFERNRECERSGVRSLMSVNAKVLVHRFRCSLGLGDLAGRIYSSPLLQHGLLCHHRPAPLHSRNHLRDRLRHLIEL